MGLTSTPIAALDEANNDDAEMRGWIYNGHCGGTIQFVGFWWLMSCCVLCVMCVTAQNRLSQQPMGPWGSYTYGGIAYDEENVFVKQIEL
jgi:hypothetical protein